MLFFDPFCGGCNVSFAAKELGLAVVSSDLFVRAFPDVIQQDYRQVRFTQGAIGWLSPPCLDFSSANPKAQYKDSLLFENPTLCRLDTIFVENVRGFRVHDRALELFASTMGYHYHRMVVDLSDYGAVQSRIRFLGCLSRSGDIVERFRNIPQRINRENVNRAWFIIDSLSIESVDDSIPVGFFRRHTGRGVTRYYPKGQNLPTLTRSNLARPWALVGREWRLPTSEIVAIEGFKWEHYSILDSRALAQSVIGDGVPYHAVSHILSSVLA